MNIENRPLSDIIPYARNPRKNDAAVSAVAGSLKEFGAQQPIVVDTDGVVVVGHTRLLAAQQLGMESFPVAVAEGLTPQQARAYRIADNKTGERAEWDFDLLRLEMEELLADGVDLDLTGFEQADLDDLLAGQGTEGLTDPDDVPDMEEEAVSKTGDIWVLGKHRLMCGDTADYESVKTLLQTNKPELIVTSPPYNQKINTFKPSGLHAEKRWVSKVSRLAYQDDMPEDEYQKLQSDLLSLWFDVMADHGSIFYNHKNRYREKSVISPLNWLPGPFSLRQEIIWARQGSVTLNARMFFPMDERVYWMYKGDDFNFIDSTEIKSWSTIWDVSNEINKTHAVAFPIELPTRCIEASSNPGDSVYDPFMGSGTTMIASEQTGRRCYGMEISPQYVDLAVRRWQEFTGKSAVLESTGEVFNGR